MVEREIKIEVPKDLEVEVPEDLELSEEEEKIIAYAAENAFMELPERKTAEVTVPPKTIKLMLSPTKVKRKSKTIAQAQKSATKVG